MNARIRIAGLTLAALTLPFCAGCRTHAFAPPSDSLVQTVRIEPAEPHQGGPITVVSTIENRGPRPVRVTHRICYLDLGGDLDLAMIDGIVRCAAVSVTTYLMPGQRVEMSEVGLVLSDPGVYTLKVNHLIDPPRTATLEVRVTK